MRSGLVDLSHTIEDGMVTYRGLPAPVVCDYMSHTKSREHYGEGTEFHIGEVRMVSNTGTYIDSPFHRFPDGPDLAELPLESVAALDGVLVRPAPSVRSIDAEWFRGVNVAGKAVLINTDWDRHWRTDQYFEGHPFLTEAAAEYLMAQGAKLVGIDSLNIDDTDDPMRPVHTILLQSEIPIVEHLRGLSNLRGREFRFHAVPVKVNGIGTFPVRAFAELGALESQ
jgi:kynurenine formamidase